MELARFLHLVGVAAVSEDVAERLPVLDCPAERISGKYVSSVTVTDGEIIVTYGNAAHAVLSGATLVLSPYSESADVLLWNCGSTSIEIKHLPAACRQPL